MLYACDNLMLLMHEILGEKRAILSVEQQPKTIILRNISL